jgi:hypothetical protein
MKTPFDDPFDTTPDERVKSSTGGYTKIQDGDTVKMRVTTNIYRYYTVKGPGDKMPLRNNDLRDLLDNRSMDDLFEDKDFEIKERYAFLVFNYETDQAEVWQVSRKLFDNLRVLNRDEDWDGGLNGNDVKVTRTGANTDTTYSINFVKTSKPLTVEQENAILELDVVKMVTGAVKL